VIQVSNGYIYTLFLFSTKQKHGPPVCPGYSYYNKHKRTRGTVIFFVFAQERENITGLAQGGTNKQKQWPGHRVR
jgi:hypothetical protein